MADYDLVIAGGTVVTPADMFVADFGIIGDKIAPSGSVCAADDRSTRTDCW